MKSSIWQIFKGAYKEFQADNVTRLAAALSYYTAVSIAPLIIFILLLIGLFLGDGAAEDQLMAQLEGVADEEAIGFISTIIENADRPTEGGIAGILSLLVLIWGSTNVFAQLQDSLNVIFDVRPKPSAGITDTVRRRFLSFSLVLVIGFLLVISLLLSVLLAVVASTLSGLLPGADYLWPILENLISLLVISLLFAAMFKVLPDVDIQWRDAWLGGALTALLFLIGKIALTFYMGMAAPGSAYGAAGSVIVFLLWVYFSSIIFFFGAEFTQIYAIRRGSGIRPSEHAIFADKPIHAD
jgi:membrane protein